MALNDLHFASERRPPWLALTFLALAVASAASGMGSRESLLLAILPATLAVAFWATGPRRFEGSVTDDGIELTRPAMLIPIGSIRDVEAVRPGGAPGSISFAIRVRHDRGVLAIPASPGINSEGIYEALWSRLAPHGSREINPVLRPYLARYERTFGPDRVWSYRAATHLRDVHRPSRWGAVGWALLATAIAWFAVEAGTRAGVQGPTPWIGWGIILLMVYGLARLVRRLLGRSGRLARIKGWHTSSLVITPVGLAMVQGDLQGELMWDQIREVKLRAQPRRFQILSDPTMGLEGIILGVDAATILIADIYDRPIASIHRRIVDYWSPKPSHEPIDL